MGSICQPCAPILLWSSHPQKTHISKLPPQMVREIVFFVSFLSQRSYFLIYELSNCLVKILQLRRKVSNMVIADREARHQFERSFERYHFFSLYKKYSLSSMKGLISEAVQAIRQADYLLITTGAGMGVDSGMPDFRGDQGFWNSFPPYSNKFTFTQCANPSFLAAHPELFWGFYGFRLNMYRNTKPHYGHEILQKIAKQKKDYFGVTSNVDGHLSRYLRDKVCEVHGTIHLNQCSNCSEIRQNSDYNPVVDKEHMRCSNLPICPKCQAVERPNILMFGDATWNSMYSDEQQSRYMEFLSRCKYGSTVILQIGAGDTISTIRRMGEQVQGNSNKLIRINPLEKEGIFGKTIAIKGKALQTLKSIEDML